MLTGALNGGITVGDVESSHADEFAAFVAELVAAGEEKLGVKLPNGVLERLKAYGRSVAHFPTAVKEVSDYRTPRHAHNKVHAYTPPPKPRRTLTPHLGLARSSSGGTDGSTRSQRRRSRRESPTRCPSTRRGSRSSALSREDQPQVVLNCAGCLFMRPCVHRRNAAGSLAREWRHCMWRHSNSGRPSA